MFLGLGSDWEEVGRDGNGVVNGFNICIFLFVGSFSFLLSLLLYDVGIEWNSCFLGEDLVDLVPRADRVLRPQKVRGCRLQDCLH